LNFELLGLAEFVGRKKCYPSLNLRSTFAQGSLEEILNFELAAPKINH